MRIWSRFGCVLVALAIFAQSKLRAEEPSAESKELTPALKAAEHPFAKDIIGVWTRRAVPPGGAPQVKGRAHKYFADRYWVATHREDSGYMLYAVGGTYDLVDGNYTESDKFGTLYCQGLIGGVFTFKIDVDRKNFWQVGMNNDYTEKYNRVTDNDLAPLAQKLHGAWTRTAVNAASAGGAPLKQFKFYESGCWIQLDTNDDGLAITARGGKYKLAYDVLTEETTSSTDFTAHPIGEVVKSKVAVKEDAILLTNMDGQQVDGPQIEEWSRAK